MFHFVLLSIGVLAAILVGATAAQETNDSHSYVEQTISFGEDVRPILSNHCFQCHGPDKDQRQAGLRLDFKNEDIDFDDVLYRITSGESFEMMPPPSAHKTLDADMITILTQWVAEGAPYEEHWSFVCPEKPVMQDGVHPVDFFIDQRLNRDGLSRSERAQPAVLIRRLFLDLVGVPPTIEQADEYINNPTQEVYEEIVSRLLESPEYGERWARRWLDLARYADTNGYEKDRDRSVWPYRDWVIRAINDGMPFDQFTIEQIAGDMLPNARIDQRIATGFHRNTMLNEEGGIDPLEFRYYAMTDRIATTGTTWLGLTIGCAQCHTHKFDPITHQDYFGMMAYLNNADEPDLYVPNEESSSSQLETEKRVAQLIAELETHWPEPGNDYNGPTLELAYQDWLGNERKNNVAWQTIAPCSLGSNSPYMQQEEDGVVFVGGDTTKHDVYELEFDAAESDVYSIRLEALPDSRHPDSGPGMTYYEGSKGDFFLSELVIQVEGAKQQKIKSASESYAKNQFGDNSVSATLAIDGDLQTGWSIYGRSGRRHVAVFNLQEPIVAGTKFSITMHFGRHFASSLGKFRLSTTDSKKPVSATTLAPKFLESLDNGAKTVELRNEFLLQAPQLSRYSDEIRKLRKTRSETSTLVMQERPVAHHRHTYLHHRGEFTDPRAKVAPRLPEIVFHGSELEMPSNRLEFARWLVSRDNPLTARVIANRQWSAFFGVGIVKTLDDFGLQGESPTHPQLLDYLAVELMDQNWSIKNLHRLIVTSETYQQTSTFKHAVANANGERLIPYFPRNRLAAEVIRDSSLFAAGLLNRKMYGPPVRPPQPEGVAANFAKSTWQASTGPERFRRSVYTYQKRTAPFAMYATFDAPSGESCVAMRDVSNTPLQALTLMNDPMFMEIAKAFGNRMATAAGDDTAKIEKGFRWLLTRKPTARELRMLVEFMEEHNDWTAVARVLLCLDEAITKN
ncbi:PSD1 and planctomycete cytochrome C domain-containing protein [bacterium]|nr:PSD1 and planctomycete cytochrome C domain-containing protein [bacterium]